MFYNSIYNVFSDGSLLSLILLLGPDMNIFLVDSQHEKKIKYKNSK